MFLKKIRTFITVFSNCAKYSTRAKICGVSNSLETLSLENSQKTNLHVIPSANTLPKYEHKKLPAKFSLVEYTIDSPALQKLVDLGADLSKLERRKGVSEFLLRLEFERNIKDHIRFLCDIGVAENNLGNFITKNPFIFGVKLENLEKRVELLNHKLYSCDMIARIVNTNPFWLMFNVDRIERRLKFFKEYFALESDSLLQQLVCKSPRLITYNIWHIKVNNMSVTQELGFNRFELKRMLLDKPKLWMLSNKSLVDRFNVIHNEMKICHDLISKQPMCLLMRSIKLRQRHQFLLSEGLAQYDPKFPNYVSLKLLVQGSDAEFAVNVARSSYSKFISFLKSL